MQTNAARVLCIADIRGTLHRYRQIESRWLTYVQGNLRSLNDLATAAKADYIIHTGDFGFYDDRSLDRIAEKWVHPIVAFLALPACIDLSRQNFEACRPILTTPVGER